MRYLIIFISIFLTACASKSPNYYSLVQNQLIEPKAVNTSVNSGISGVKVNLSKIPTMYERPQIIIYDEFDANKLHVLNYSLWATPLFDQIQQVLSNDIAAYLGVPNINNFITEDSILVYKVQINKFDVAVGGALLLQANWSVKESTDKSQIICTATLKMPNAGVKDVAGLVHRKQQAISLLAKIMAYYKQSKTLLFDPKIISYNIGCT